MRTAALTGQIHIHNGLPGFPDPQENDIGRASPRSDADLELSPSSASGRARCSAIWSSLSDLRRAGGLAHPVAAAAGCRCRPPRSATSWPIWRAMGLLYAPHTSAGRVPTEKGLRLFVDGLLEIGELDRERARRHRGAHCRHRAAARGRADAGRRAAVRPVALRRPGGRAPSRKSRSSMSSSSPSAPGKALVVMVGEDGQVENRLIDTPLGLPAFGAERGRRII